MQEWSEQTGKNKYQTKKLANSETSPKDNRKIRLTVREKRRQLLQIGSYKVQSTKI